jgi:hypothetical protein
MVVSKSPDRDITKADAPVRPADEYAKWHVTLMASLDMISESDCTPQDVNAAMFMLVADRYVTDLNSRLNRIHRLANKWAKDDHHDLLGDTIRGAGKQLLDVLKEE